MHRTTSWLSLAVACAAWLATGSLAHSATITIVNNDEAGEGFNDPNPASPIGGNPGTTIGAQRLYVFQHAASIWGGLLPSTVEIRVNAQFNPQSCTATSGVLGSAGPATQARDFPNAPFASTWYHVALGNKLAGVDLFPASNDINTTFNSSLGQPACLPAGWYYGVDGNEGSQIELLPVVLHELGHGLGFSTSTNGASGGFLNGFPHIYDRRLYDNGTGLHWNQMTAGQRVASATQCTNLVWDGAYTTAAVPVKLAARPVLTVNAPGAIDGDYEAAGAEFGAALDASGITGNVVLANDGVANPSNACEPLVNAGAIAGNIALVDRGTCGFTVKVQLAQDAGAIAVIVADSLPSCPLPGMSGVAPSITIPSLRISQADGAAIKAHLGSGVNVTLRVDPARRIGTDAAGRLRVYTPSSFAGGSSISHWDVTAEPNLLMEPALNRSLSSDVDLTQTQFADIGWYTPLVAVEEALRPDHRLEGAAPNPMSLATTISFTLAREEPVELAVYDLRGRLVSRVLEQRMPQGRHRAKWSGLDRDGRPVAAGVYLYRLRTPGFSESRHLAVVR